MYKRIMDIDPWLIKSNKIEKEERRLQESLTSIGNGYMGMRGNFSETYSGDHHEGIYIAGVWYPDKTRVGWWKNGYPDYFGKVVNALNFAKIKIFVDDKEVDLYGDEISNFSIKLDMQKGILSYDYTFHGVAFSTERFFSIVQKELAVFAYMVESADGADHKVRIESFIDSDVHNEDANFDERFWEVVNHGNQQTGSFLSVQTIENSFDVERFTVLAQQIHFGDFQAVRQARTEKAVVDIFETDLTAGKVQTFEKRVLVFNSRNYESYYQMTDACTEKMEELILLPYFSLFSEQMSAWKKRWETADVVISGSDEAQQGIRFNLFQLFSTYYGEEAHLNIGPKGFTGEKYGGATYWDTEAYVIPMYLALTDPQVSRNLLKYRHDQLAEAQHNARQQGLAGALYPMVTFNGIECHNEWEITFEEIHRNGAIAYAIYNYTNYTGETDYLAHEGLEVLVEIARFWADRVHFSSRAGKYMIYGVTGPNEYENNVNNNWYTNTLAAWVLAYTKLALQEFSRPDLAVTAEELAKWQDIIDKMYYPVDEERGIFVQQDGYLDKDLKPVSALAPSDLPLNQNWSWDKILRSPYIKQADVLQGLYLFGDMYSLDEKRKNFEFYEPLTVHESSLSPSIHAILAAELGLEEKAIEMYQRTARLDLDNYNNDSQDGLHITSMAGSWLAIVHGFAQMKTWSGKLSFAPFLPHVWTGYAFHVNYRSRLMKIEVGDKVTVSLLKGDPLSISLYGNEVELKDSLTVDKG